MVNSDPIFHKLYKFHIFGRFAAQSTGLESASTPRQVGLSEVFHTGALAAALGSSVRSARRQSASTGNQRLTARIGPNSAE